MGKRLKIAAVICLIAIFSISEFNPFLGQVSCASENRKYATLYHKDKYNLYYNEELSGFEVSSDDPEYASYEGCLYSKDYTKLIAFPKDKDSVIFHPNLKVIGTYAFESSKKLREIVIPWGVTHIETRGVNSAFDSEKPILKIILPDTLEEIDDSNSSVGRYCKGIYIYSQDNTAAKNVLEGHVSGSQTLFCFEVDSVDYYYGESKETPKILSGDWYSLPGGTFCVDINGEKLVGWQNIDGNQYYFLQSELPDSKGYMIRGFEIIDGNRYYFDLNGIMQTGWQNIEEEWYFFDEDGIMQTGWQEIDGERFFFDENGVMQTGLFDENGARLTGWQEIEGKRYYLDEDGDKLTGWQEIDNELYYLEDDGAMIPAGWQEVKRGKYYYWLYFDETGAMARNCWEKIDGKWTRFDEDGGVKKGFWISIAAWFRGLWS